MARPEPFLSLRRSPCRMRAAALSALVLISAPAGATAPRLECGTLQLALDPAGGAIVELALPGGGPNLVDPEAPAPVWQLEFGPPDGEVVVPHRARTFRVEPGQPEGQAFSLHWGGFDLAAAPELRVDVEVVLDAAAPLSRWSIAVEGLGTLRPAAVRFPRVGGLARRGAETLAVPEWMGKKTGRARELLSAGGQPRRFEWEYPGLLSMQCLSLATEGGPGFYAACDDGSAFGKRFALFGDGTGALGFEIVQLPALGAAAPAAYRSPYAVVLGAVEGDWLEAAAIYRQWALGQSWCRESRLRTGRVAEWVAHTGLWVWNRGRSPEVLVPARALQEAAGVPVSVFWHWWHGCAYDIGFPEYLPPREGAAPFRAAVADAQRQGLHAIIYMNQRLWGMTTRSWAERGAERYAVKGADGTVRPEVYNTFTKAPCASMCMGTRFWRDTYAALAEAAVLDLGVDGIYMDQACSSLACLDSGHGHPLGGGTYWMEGFRALESDIRGRCDAAARGVVLAGEGCGEAWLPHLDLMLSLQVSMERYAAPGEWEPIPLFHAVYHSCAVLYGNYSSLTRPPYDDLWPAEFAPERPLELLDRKFSTQFRLEQARAFAWGQQPTIANFLPGNLVERKEEMEFVLKLARVRRRALPYLRDGTFLRPPAVGIEELTIPSGQETHPASRQ